MTQEDRYDEGVAYWQARYLNEPKPCDWILKYEDLREILQGITGGDRSLRFLHVGCGNSILPESMYDDGFTDMVNIDTSDVVIGQMRERNAEARPAMEWLVMDATATEYSAGTFDVVLDKALLDTLLCEGNADGVLISRYFREMARVVKSPGGLVLLVTFGPPEDRISKVPNALFDVDAIAVPAKGNKISGSHYVYVCRRKECETEFVCQEVCSEQTSGIKAFLGR